MDESFIMNRPTRLTLISGYRTSPCDMSKLRVWSEKGTGSSLCYLIDLLYIPSFRRECRSTKRSYKRTSTVCNAVSLYVLNVVEHIRYTSYARESSASLQQGYLYQSDRPLLLYISFSLCIFKLCKLKS